MSLLKRDSDNASHQSTKRQRVSAPITELTLVKTTDTNLYNSYVSFSPDGTTAAAFRVMTTRLINVNDGAVIHLLRGHSGAIKSVSFSPDGTKVASGGWDKVVKLWDVTTGKCLKTLERDSTGVMSLSFSPDGTKLALGSVNKMVELWDVAKGNLLWTLVGHVNSVMCVSFSPDGTKVASASYDHTARLWDVTSGECLKTLEEHSLGVMSVSFSPDGTKMASASVDKTVKLWDVTSKTLLLTLHGHSDGVNNVSFSPDGTKVASASYGKVKLWDVTSRECLQTLEERSDDVEGVSFFPNATFKIAYKSLDSENMAISTYVFTWVIDAKNFLLAFANRHFSGDPLPFVRRMYPHFFDQGRYLFYNDKTERVERKTEAEISQWFEQKRIELIAKNLDGLKLENDAAVNENILLKLTRLKF